MKVSTRFMEFFAVFLLLANSLPAQEPYAPKALTVQDYKSAEKYMDRKWYGLVYRSGVQAKWTDDYQFTYQTSTPEGPVTYVVNAKKKSKTVLVPENPSADKSASKPASPTAAQRAMNRFRSNGILSPDGKKEAFIKDHAAGCSGADCSQQGLRSDSVPERRSWLWFTGIDLYDA